MKDLVIRDSKLRLIGMTLICFLFAGVNFLIPSDNPNIFEKVWIVFSILLFSLCGILLLKCLIFQKPVAILSQQGLTLPQLLPARNIIPWNEIMHVRIEGKRENPYICIEIEDFSGQHIKQTINISFISTKYTCKEVLELLKEYQMHYMQWYGWNHSLEKTLDT